MIGERLIWLYTDGGVRPTNPGPAAWAYAAVRQGELWVKDSDHMGLATNNQAEMTALLMGLYRFEGWPEPITVVSDSKYVIGGCTEWLPGWKQRQWHNSTGKPLENRWLWQELDRLLLEFPDLAFKHVRGHQGDQWNEFVDEMCSAHLTE